MNKPLQPYAHALLDYITGLLLIVSPWLFQFANLSIPAKNTMVTVGLFIIILSFFTAYPLGLVKAIPFKTHGVLETLGAIILLFSPWMIGFSHQTQAATTLAVIVGVVWLGVVAVTNYTSQSERMVH